MIEEKRIYVVVAGAFMFPAQRRSVIQPPGRQIAQACHVVSKLRHSVQFDLTRNHDFNPITTIILFPRDSAELRHVTFLSSKRKLHPIVFFDINTEAYGGGSKITNRPPVIPQTKPNVDGPDLPPLSAPPCS